MEIHDGITEDQRKRAEANRIAALAKRKAVAVSSTAVEEATTTITDASVTLVSTTAPTAPREPWKLFKCRKTSSDFPSIPKKSLPAFPVDPFLKPQAPAQEKFRAWFEICSPDSFSIKPVAAKGFKYPGDAECLKKLSHCLPDVAPSHYTQNSAGGKAGVYKLRDYDTVIQCLRNLKGIEIEEIPWGTLNVVERLSHSSTTGQWTPCRPEHLSDDKVDELIGKLPKSLFGALRPFQLDGIRFGLRRGGRCLIADEMGLGKTLQAIAIAGCFMNEGSVLIVCPAILRFTWAEELEHWLCLPSDIHLVAGF